METEVDIQWRYKVMVESLKLLALPYDEQKPCFPDFVYPPYEVLNTFDYDFDLLPPVIESGMLSYNGIAWILRVQWRINANTHNPNMDIDDEEQFKNHPKWDEVREFAKQVLTEINEPMGKPNVDGTTYANAGD